MNKNGYLKVYNHCKQRAFERFRYNLEMSTWFDMWNGKVPVLEICTVKLRQKSEDGKRSCRGKGKVVTFIGLPGAWVVNNSGMPKTCLTYKHIGRIKQ